MKKSNISVTKIATIALALSAVASPLAANAATEPLTDYYTAALTKAGEGIAPSTNVAVVSGTAAYRLVDPLKLAEQYAPDSVETWKATLADYDALMKEKYGDLSVTVSASAVPLPVDGKGVIRSIAPVLAVTSTTKADTTEGKKVSVRIGDGQAQFVPAQQLEGLKQANTVTIEAMPGSKAGTTVTSAWTTAGAAALTGAVPVASVDGKPVELAGKTAAGGQAASVTLTDGATLTMTQVDAQPDPFFTSQLALGKAAQSKDAAAIKDDLAKLLKQYHIRIDELRKAE